MATNNNHTHTDTASGKGGGALTESPASSPTSDPGANPGDLATDQGSDNAKSRDVLGGADHDPEKVAGLGGSTSPDAAS